MTELAFGHESYKTQNWKWKEDLLGPHLIECIDSLSITPFPKITTSNLTRIFMLSQGAWNFEVGCLCRQPILDKSFYSTKKKLNWVQCSNGNCKRWFHVSCALMLEANISSVQDTNWLCLHCEKKSGIYILLDFQTSFNYYY